MADVRRKRVGCVQWDVLPEWESLLLGPEGLRLQQWLNSGQAHVVKHGEHRTVYRVDLAEKRFYLKHYRCRTWRDGAKQLFRSSAARREWRKTVAVIGRALPTAHPVAIGEAHVNGVVRDNYFVTEAIPDSKSLDDFLAHELPRLPTAQAARLRREIIRRLADLCAAFHRAGVDQDDLHTGNVLIRLDQHDGEGHARLTPRLYMIDLPGVRLSGSLNWKRSRDSLAMLAAAFLTRSSRADKARFWTQYLLGRRDLPLSDTGAAAREVLTRARRHARRILRGRDKRCLRNNRDFYTCRAPAPRGAMQGYAAQGYAARDVPPETLEAILSCPDEFISRFRHTPAKLSHSSVVVQGTLTLAPGAVCVAFKRTRVKSWWKRRLWRFRQSRAMHGWRMGNALEQRGVATARPLLVCQSTQGGDAYLVTQWLEGARNLHLWAWELAERPSALRRREAMRCAAALGRLIGACTPGEFRTAI